MSESGNGLHGDIGPLRPVGVKSKLCLPSVTIANATHTQSELRGSHLVMNLYGDPPQDGSEVFYSCIKGCTNPENKALNACFDACRTMAGWT
jgi:hypothetical protein